MTAHDTPLYQGRLIALALETVCLPNGHNVQLEVVRHPGGAVAVALDGSDRVCLLKQHRHAVRDESLWELPAGCIDKSDLYPLDTARRELQEEAGVRASRWMPLGTIYPSPGFCNEVLHLYLARELTLVDTSQDMDEVIEVHWLDFNHALSMAAAGEIVDSKTVAGLFRADYYLHRQG